MSYEISQEELDQRVAIVKRFKRLLELQRKKFQEYLEVLQLQETKIAQDDADSLLSHTELETQILRGIEALQKVIDPMRELYEKNRSEADDLPVWRVKEELSKLQLQVASQNEKNRRLLKDRMVQIKKQIAEFRNPYRSLNSIYAQKQFGAATRVKVEV